MLKNIKKIFIISLIFILTGCSVEYDLTINEDYSISEKVVAQEKTKKMESLTKSKGDNAVNYLYNMFKRNNITPTINTVTDISNTYTTVFTSHDDINEYASNFKSDIFKKVDVEKKNNIVTFTANQTIPLGNNSNYSLIYDDLTIKINIPFKVIEHNADSVVGNNYIWKIDKNNKIKNIKVTYNEGSKKNSININVNNKTYNISYAIIIISGIILTVAIIIVIVVINNKKNNSF